MKLKSRKKSSPVFNVIDLIKQICTSRTSSKSSTAQEFFVSQIRVAFKTRINVASASVFHENNAHLFCARDSC